MLCMPDKFLYQNQLQNTRYITFYTNTQKFPHLLSPSNRFYQIRLQRRSMTKHLVHKKSWGGICTYHAFKNIHQKYIITHTVHTTVLNVSFLQFVFLLVIVKQNTHQVTKHLQIKNTCSYNCIHNATKTVLKENYVMGRQCGNN